MRISRIIGADLSKKTIDFALYNGGHIVVENSPSGYQQFLKWTQSQKINATEMFIVMEHTGLYSSRLEQFLHQHNLFFTKVSGLAIKRSMGLVRGKNDKIDAIRIARYGFEKQQNLVPLSATDQHLERLERLHALRDQMVKQRAALYTSASELQQVLGLSKNDDEIAIPLRLVKNYDKEIGQVEAQIAAVIQSQQPLKQNYELLQSIKGVGKVVATATLIKTGNFTRFTDARKFACYCGTAPFENSSGSSVKGRTRVSHLADKKMKALLDLAAKTAIQYDPELRDYYLRKTAEGKAKMSTINVVRNKIIYRMFAVIKRQTPFVDEYLTAA
jgi:transposase